MVMLSKFFVLSIVLAIVFFVSPDDVIGSNPGDSCSSDSDCTCDDTNPSAERLLECRSGECKYPSTPECKLRCPDGTHRYNYCSDSGGASCGGSTDCTKKCKGTQKYTGCGGDGADSGEEGCSDLVECAGTCRSDGRSYIGCSSGSCSGSVCDTGCGSGCDDNSDCSADSCFGTCGSAVNGCVWRDNFCSDSSCSCANTDYDVDTTSGRCTGCGQSWNIGGEVAGTACCGDDSGEYKKTETSGSDAPSGYGDGITTCCNVNNDCTYNDVCYASGAVSSSAIPNKAYCNLGTWQGGDAGSGRCNAIIGTTGYWGLGGEVAGSVCCGDDNGEYRRTETASGSDAPSGYDDGITTCCNSNTDCTYNDVCVPAGSTSSLAIPNKAYCNSGAWRGGDDGSTACSQITGALNLWNLGGDIDGSACCGDDGTETRKTCADAGAGACVESNDDEACCTDSNACVYDNQCYSNSEETPNGAWLCNLGVWEPAGVNVIVEATPSSVTTAWQNTDAIAQIDCSSPSAVNPCDPPTYMLRTHDTNPVTCSNTYSDYTLSDPQTISSHKWVCGTAKNTLGTDGFSENPVEFRVDKIKPRAVLGVLPSWTTVTSVTIDWTGSDNGGSGLDFIELQVRVRWTNSSLIQDWTDWTTSTLASGSLSYSGMQNNKTYYFRARANDNAGNVGDWSVMEDINVDIVAPSCSMEEIPLYTNTPIFDINWSGFDGETGIDYYYIEGMSDAAGCGMPTAWGTGATTTDTSDIVTGLDGCTYFYRCRSTDVAGNDGAFSNIINTTIDATAPISNVLALSQWWNKTMFDVNWIGYDDGVGLDCYDIQWSDDAADWNDWFTCERFFSSTFGDGSPINLADNSTYYFRSRARDLAGNEELWPPVPDAETTIDFTPPQINRIKAYDQDGVSLIGNILKIGTINITFSISAFDNTSGVQENVIEWIITLEGGESTGSYDCGPAVPYGGVSRCNHTLSKSDLEGMVMIEFWIRTKDRAGNVNVSQSYNLGTHPLANFGRHSVYISIGETTTLGVYVRNIKDQPDNVTIKLTSELPIDPYFIVLKDMTWVVDRWIGDNIELMDNNMTIIIYNLNPGAAPPPFPVRIWSSDSPNTYQINLEAYSTQGMDDTDTALVQVNYPASFPGLNEWAIVLLVLFAILIYYTNGMKKDLYQTRNN